MAKGKTTKKGVQKRLRVAIVSGVKKLLSDQDKKLDKKFSDQNESVKKLLSDQGGKVKKLLSDQEKKINKLLVAQDIRNWGKMEELEEKFEKHTTKLKSDFLEKIDPILKEVTTAREERPLIVNRIEALEDIHQKGKHSLPVTN